jgi:hypothetical protein
LNLRVSGVLTVSTALTLTACLSLLSQTLPSVPSCSTVTTHLILGLLKLKCLLLIVEWVKSAQPTQSCLINAHQGLTQTLQKRAACPALIV